MHRTASLNARQGASGARSRLVGFTLLELLLAMAVFSMVIYLIVAALDNASTAWIRARNRIDAFQSARFAFSLMTSTLSQSRLNVYGDYDDPSRPTRYVRQSDLHFLIRTPPVGPDFGQGNAVFFQAPLGRSLNSSEVAGKPGLLNAVGYYVVYGKNPSLPTFLADLDDNRFRLMQFLQPSERLAVYSDTLQNWYSSDLAQYSTVIADNVILLLFWPLLPEQEDPEGDDLASVSYLYDSRAGREDVPQPITANQQPPIVEVTMVAISESAAQRLPQTSEPPGAITTALNGLFETASRDAYREDLARLSERLSGEKIEHHIFQQTVVLREAKWNR